MKRPLPERDEIRTVLDRDDWCCRHCKKRVTLSYHPCKKGAIALCHHCHDMAEGRIEHQFLQITGNPDDNTLAFRVIDRGHDQRAA